MASKGYKFSPFCIHRLAQLGDGGAPFCAAGSLGRCVRLDMATTAERRDPVEPVGIAAMLERVDMVRLKPACVFARLAAVVVSLERGRLAACQRGPSRRR